MNVLFSLRHCNVIPFLGYIPLAGHALQVERLMLVREWSGDDSAVDYLERNPGCDFVQIVGRNFM